MVDLLSNHFAAASVGNITSDILYWSFGVLVYVLFFFLKRCLKKIFFSEFFLNVAEFYWRRCLDSSGQQLDNAAQTIWYYKLVQLKVSK